MRFVITVLITIAFILAVYYLMTRVILPIFGIDIISEQFSSRPVESPAFQCGMEQYSIPYATEDDCGFFTLAGNIESGFDKSSC